MKRRNNKPPSKVRYDQAHPTVSIRVTRETYDELDALRYIGGKSLGDILREALDEQTPSALKAYQTGYDDGKRKFAVTYKCSICGGDIILSSQAEKEAAAESMRKLGWVHRACRDKKT